MKKKSSKQGRRARRSFTSEFKADAVRLVRSGKSIPEVARDLDLTETALREWVRRAEADAGEREDVLTTEERQELARLRREVKTLRQEREILKAAAADSVGHRNASAKISSGVRNASDLRGRELRRAAILFNDAWVYPERSVPLGRYWRTKPLVFSFVPRCHGLPASQKNTGTRASSVRFLCRASSGPRSHVSERRTWTGSFLISRPTAATTALESLPAT